MFLTIKPFGGFLDFTYMTYPTVVNLAVHLENGQRVYFKEANALQRAENPPETTFTAFFKLCQQDEFSKRLFY